MDRIRALITLCRDSYILSLQYRCRDYKKNCTGPVAGTLDTVFF